MYKIYGKTNCVSCINAKMMMKQSGLPFEFINVEGDVTLMPAGHKTVPVVYDSKGSLIGGYNDLLVHLSTEV